MRAGRYSRTTSRQSRNLDVSLVLRDLDPQPEAAVQEMTESVQEVMRFLVAAMNQRVLAGDEFDAGIVFVERRDVRIVLPGRRAWGTHVREELSGMTAMQVPDGGCQHHDVARRLRVAENESSHDCVSL